MTIIFTVIDNMLFVHFSDMKERKANEPVILVPDEIYKRMCSFANMVFVSPLVYNASGIITGISIVTKDNKHYIAFSADRTSTIYPRYHYSIYLLKDI